MGHGVCSKNRSIKHMHENEAVKKRPASALSDRDTGKLHKNRSCKGEYAL
jgi:hypothetical protein